MDFKFNIGDKVTGLSVAEFVQRGLYEKELHLGGNKTGYPKSMVIVQKRYDECTGGVQRHYFCSAEFEGSRTAAWYNEIELAPYPQEQVTRALFNYLDSRIASKKE